MRPDGGKEAPGALARPAWGEEGGPGLRHRSRRRDEGFSRESPASGGVHAPGGDGYAAKTGTPAQATMPGRAFHCGGREGGKPAAPAAGQWLGGKPAATAMLCRRTGRPLWPGGARALAGRSGRKVWNPLAAIVPARGNPAGGVHASDCMRPGCPVGFGGHDFHGTGSYPGRTPGGGRRR